MSAGPDARQLALDLAMTAVGEGWTGYASPPSTPAVPAVVVWGGQPYRERLANGACWGLVHVRVALMRPVAAEAYDELDALLDTVASALETDSRLMVDAIAGIEYVNVGGVDYVAGRLDASVYIEN